ncbi:MAG: hypothetical protein LBV74_16920 [Tannerella sp.]|jgi:hypothetical protein|nr:hypothetical protein [Tannerella sp.]
MSKKKIFGSIAVLAIAAMAAFNVNVNSQDNGLSYISLDNAEALASESSDCPNGCLDQSGNGCWCRTWHTYVKEAKW